MRTLKNMMQKVLVAVLSLAMAITFTPSSAFTVNAEEGYGAWAGIYFGGSNAYFQSEHPEAVEMKVALYADGVKQQEYDFVASATDGTLNVDNLKEKNETGEDIVYTWKIVSKSDIPEGFVVRIEPTNDGNNVVKFYLEGEIETEVNEAGEVVPVKDPETGKDKVITFNPDDFEDFGNNEGQNGEGQNGKGQNGEGQNGENGQNGEGKDNQDVNSDADNKDNKDNKDGKDNQDNKDSKDAKDDKTAVAGAIKLDGPKVGTKIKDSKYTYVVTKAGSKDGKIAGEVAITGLRKKSLTKLRLSKTCKLDGVKYIVTEVKANAFKGNKKATYVVISKNIRKVGKSAFANMKKLKRVVVTSRKLKSIGKKAFAGDKKLKSVKFKSKKLKNVGKKAFSKVSKKCVFKVAKAKKVKYAKLLKKAGFKGKVK